MDAHVCKGLVGQQDLISKAIEFAKQIYDQHQFEVIHAGTNVNSLDVFEPVRQEIQHAPNICGYVKGWAKAKQHGQKYGRKYVDPFKQDIVEMFNIGNENEALKRGPGKMLSELRRKYPGRLDLPSETEIRSVISCLMAKKRKGQSQINNVNVNRGIPEPFKSTVLEIFRADPNVVPRRAWDIFLQRHPPTDNAAVLSYESKVKSKISSLKVQFRKTSELP